MKKVRTYAVLFSIVASAGMLSACGNDENDEVADSTGTVEAPVTQAPSAADTAPSVPDTPPATAPSTTDSPSTTTGPSTGSTTGSADDSATDITPEPDAQ